MKTGGPKDEEEDKMALDAGGATEVAGDAEELDGPDDSRGG